MFNLSSNGCTRVVSSQDGRPDRCGPFNAEVLSTHQNNFTSQLDLPVLPEYNGRTIWCNTIKDGENMIIGTYTINYASGILPSLHIIIILWLINLMASLYLLLQ